MGSFKMFPQVYSGFNQKKTVNMYVYVLVGLDRQSSNQILKNLGEFEKIAGHIELT
jgi:hypothetical protein